jgi:hypothetical protein
VNVACKVRGRSVPGQQVVLITPAALPEDEDEDADKDEGLEDGECADDGDDGADEGELTADEGGDRGGLEGTETAEEGGGPGEETAGEETTGDDGGGDGPAELTAGEETAGDDGGKLEGARLDGTKLLRKETALLIPEMDEKGRTPTQHSRQTTSRGVPAGDGGQAPARRAR